MTLFCGWRVHWKLGGEKEEITCTYETKVILYIYGMVMVVVVF